MLKNVIAVLQLVTAGHGFLNVSDVITVDL